MILSQHRPMACLGLSFPICGSAFPAMRTAMDSESSWHGAMLEGLMLLSTNSCPQFPTAPFFSHTLHVWRFSIKDVQNCSLQNLSCAEAWKGTGLLWDGLCYDQRMGWKCPPHVHSKTTRAPEIEGASSGRPRSLEGPGGITHVLHDTGDHYIDSFWMSSTFFNIGIQNFAKHFEFGVSKPARP